MSLKYNTLFNPAYSPNVGLLCALYAVLPGTDSDILLEEHYVPVVSLVPSMTGSVSNIYVRERVSDRVRSSNELEGQVVLFIHGAGTPGRSRLRCACSRL